MEKIQNLVQRFDDKMVHCYCMAICMYVVALVNCISFDEGEEMNKVIAITFPYQSIPFAAAIPLTVCNFHKEQRILSLKHEVQQEHFDTLSQTRPV